MVDQTEFIQLCIQFSSLGLVYYDYILTFAREVKLIWLDPQPFRFGTVLYFSCRYALVANVVFTLALVRDVLPFSCNIAYRLSAALCVVGRATVIVVWGMRCYAMFNKSRVILLLFGPLGLIVIILAILRVPNMKCAGVSNNTTAESTVLLATSTVIYEVMLTVCTTFRAVQALKSGGSWREQRDGLMFLLFHQGILYYVTVAGFRTTAMILNYTEPNGSFMRRLLNGFTNPISGIMTARFLLHLRAWHRRSVHVSSIEGEEEIRFASFRSAVATFVDDFGEDPIRMGQSEVLP